MKGRRALFAILFGGLFAVAVILGCSVYETGSLECLSYGRFGIFRLLVVVWGVSSIAPCLASILFKWAKEATLLGGVAPELSDRFVGWSVKFFFLALVVIFLAWTPCYLAYYPGIFSYDISYQMDQVATGNFNSHHPLLHALFWALCYKLGMLTGLEVAPIIVYSISQMLILSASCAVAVTFLRANGYPGWVVFLSLAYFALNPTIAVFSFIPVKDVLSGAFSSFS